jgi:hypothetical protein
VEYEEVQYEPPQAILDRTTALEAEIAGEIKEIEKLLK